MFLENSRYFDVETVQTTDSKGRAVTAIRLRRLPFVEGTETIVKGNDRLDVIAQRRYGDSTKFWRIADANTELAANDLLEQRPQLKEPRTIRVPEK